MTAIATHNVHFMNRFMLALRKALHEDRFEEEANGLKVKAKCHPEKLASPSFAWYANQLSGISLMQPSHERFRRI